MLRGRLDLRLRHSVLTYSNQIECAATMCSVLDGNISMVKGRLNVAAQVLSTVCGVIVPTLMLTEERDSTQGLGSDGSGGDVCCLSCGARRSVGTSWPRLLREACARNLRWLRADIVGDKIEVVSGIGEEVSSALRQQQRTVLSHEVEKDVVAGTLWSVSSS